MEIFAKFKSWLTENGFVESYKVELPKIDQDGSLPIKYKCERCYDNGYIVVIGPKIYYTTAYSQPTSTKACEFCERGKAYGPWLKALQSNPEMSNDVRAYYLANKL